MLLANKYVDFPCPSIVVTGSQDNITLGVVVVLSGIGYAPAKEITGGFPLLRKQQGVIGTRVDIYFSAICASRAVVPDGRHNYVVITVVIIVASRGDRITEGITFAFSLFREEQGVIGAGVGVFVLTGHKTTLACNPLQ